MGAEGGQDELRQRRYVQLRWCANGEDDEVQLGTEIAVNIGSQCGVVPGLTVSTFLDLPRACDQSLEAASQTAAEHQT